MKDHARRMYSDAVTRLHDATILFESLRAQSDAPSQLRILGFEVLLKCALTLNSITVPRKEGHNYKYMWALLPPDAESVIMAVARERSPRLAQLDGIDRLLIAYQLIFTKFRYYYELHEDLTSEQLREKGERWLNNGAPESEADVVYYDEELVCLIAGLRAYVEARL